MACGAAGLLGEATMSQMERVYKLSHLISSSPAPTLLSAARMSPQFEMATTCSWFARPLLKDPMDAWDAWRLLLRCFSKEWL